MNSLAQFFHERYRLSVFIIALTHIVGVIGISSIFSESFLMLSPANLLLCCFILLSGHSNTTRTHIYGMLAIAVIGFMIEWLGVHTGIIFGEYSYGATLGPKLDEIPIIIAVNWLILTYAIGNVVARFIGSFWLRIIAGALIMVALDVLIEPVAIRLDMWSWVAEDVPLKNYIAWFIVSLGTMSVYFKTVHNENNRIAEWVIFIQVLFFGLLNFV